MAGIRSALPNGFTTYAIAPAWLARSTSSRWLKAVSITTGAIRSAGDLLGRADAVELGHLDVHHDQIGLQVGGQLDGGLAVSGLADDVVPLFGQHLDQVEADQHLVLGHDHSGRGPASLALGVSVSVTAHTLASPCYASSRRIPVALTGALWHE